jgi:adenosine kinase
MSSRPRRVLEPYLIDKPQPMRIVVTGSIAYDYIMVFPGKFRDHILPEKMHILSVSFLVDSLRRLYGGTAANICFNLALLGERPSLLGAVGEDFGEYRQWLDRHGVDTSTVRTISGEFTSSCFINTDMQDNQITAFYPGAMSHTPQLSVRDLGLTSRDLVVVAPNDPRAMGKYARECAELGIPYLYDPSMQAPRMTAEELGEGFRGASILTGNDYEFGMMAEKLGISEDELARRVPVTVMTRGEAGSLITAGNERYEIPPARPVSVVDPTGAGDAYRAGLMLGLRRRWPWPVAGRVAALAAVYAIEHPGTQQHRYTPSEFVARYRDNFGASEELDSLMAS